MGLVNLNLVHVLVSVQAQRRHKNSHRNAGGELTGAVEELRGAFERAERACPGLCDVFLCEMLHRLAPGLSLHRIQDALERLRLVPARLLARPPLVTRSLSSPGPSRHPAPHHPAPFLTRPLSSPGPSPYPATPEYTQLLLDSKAVVVSFRHRLKDANTGNRWDTSAALGWNSCSQ